MMMLMLIINISWIEVEL